MKRKIKPLIYVFCEGESEIEYVNFLKEKYEDVAVIQKPIKGLFSTANKKFKKEAKYRNNAEVTDEIWFFFDVDDGQTGSWDKKPLVISIHFNVYNCTGCNQISGKFIIHKFVLSKTRGFQ